MTYVLNDYADLSRVISDQNYAREKFIKVKKQDHLFLEY